MTYRKATRITRRKASCFLAVLFLLSLRENIPEEKVLLLKHLVLSHHGQPDFGAAVKPMCIEAELLSCVDMIDSRVEIYSEATANLDPGEFSAKIFALDKRVFKH